MLADVGVGVVVALVRVNAESIAGSDGGLSSGGSVGSEHPRMASSDVVDAGGKGDAYERGVDDSVTVSYIPCCALSSCIVSSGDEAGGTVKGEEVLDVGMRRDVGDTSNISPCDGVCACVGVDAGDCKCSVEEEMGGEMCMGDVVLRRKLVMLRSG